MAMRPRSKGSIAGLALALVVAAVPATAQDDSSLPPGWQPITTTTAAIPGAPPPPPTTMGDSPTERTPDTSLPPGWQDVDTPITPLIPSAGSGPLIRCAWQLPDMDLSMPGMQYVDAMGAFDDDSLVGSSRPCGPQSVGSDASHTVQLRGPASGMPRTLEMWAVVDHPDGPGAVTTARWEVFYPDGQVKEEVEASLVDRSLCRELEDTMFAAGVGTSQLESDMVEDANAGLVVLCDEGVSALLAAQVFVAKTEPCGQYRVEFLVADGQRTALHTSYFDVECYVHVDLSFDEVKFGGGGDTGVAEGRSFAATGTRTVRNEGSGGLNLGVLFREMVPVDIAGDPIAGFSLDTFGATLQLEGGASQSDDAIPAGTVIWFVDDDATLCAGDAATLDLWIADAVESLPAGTYRGGLTVIARPAGVNADGVHTCSNDNGVWAQGAQR